MNNERLHCWRETHPQWNFSNKNPRKKKITVPPTNSYFLEPTGDLWHHSNDYLATKMQKIQLPWDWIATWQREDRAADLLYEEVAGLLQQNNEACWGVVVSGVGPHQAHRVHQRANLTPDIRKLHVLHVLEQTLQGPQVGADVPRLLQRWQVKMCSKSVQRQKTTYERVYACAALQTAAFHFSQTHLCHYLHGHLVAC